MIIKILFVYSDDSAIFTDRPETVTIILKETQTYFIFEMPQMTEDLRTPEGQMVQQENQNYEYVTVGPGSNRKLLDAETQTIRVLTKSRGTYLGMRPRRNQDVFVNNWVIYDTYAAPELMTEKNGRMIVHTRESMNRMRQAQANNFSHIYIFGNKWFNAQFQKFCHFFIKNIVYTITKKLCTNLIKS